MSATRCVFLRMFMLMDRAIYLCSHHNNCYSRVFFINKLKVLSFYFQIHSEVNRNASLIIYYITKTARTNCIAGSILFFKSVIALLFKYILYSIYDFTHFQSIKYYKIPYILNEICNQSDIIDCILKNRSMFDLKRSTRNVMEQ